MDKIEFSRIALHKFVKDWGRGCRGQQTIWDPPQGACLSTNDYKKSISKEDQSVQVVNFSKEKYRIVLQGERQRAFAEDYSLQPFSR